MIKTHEEIAADILSAALQTESGILDKTEDVAKNLGQAYRIILQAVRQADQKPDRASAPPA